MHLLKAAAGGTFSLSWFAPDHIPPYAILSHRWEAEEVTFQDLNNGVASSKAGYRKIQFCREQAIKDGLEYFWVDSCCIDKTSSAELSEAINSMFSWYQNATKCYVYLSDVSTGRHSRSSELLWESRFCKSQWFTRGWTLQELLAPCSVEFFSRDGMRLGDKRSLENQIQQTTGIAVQALRGDSLSQFSIEERMSWAENRKTTKEEDQAYCLLGIFGIFLPIIYGEGKKNAQKRLREEINKVSEELKCLQALRTSDYEQFKARNPDRLEGTCKWFLQHDRFREWQQSASGLLWVSADPGCGKSVLAKSLIDQELKSTKRRTTCYFFFKDDNDKQKSSTTALSSLLHQLFSQKRSLIQHAMRDYETEGSHLPNAFHKLWAILVRAITDPKAGEVVCILDALDECAEAERYQIIDTLSTFYRQSHSNSQLKFLVTSRPYFDIERRFAKLIRHFPTIRLHGEKESKTISREIDIVIRSTVSELRQELELDDSEQSTLQEGLLAMEHRTYLWLKLIIEVICDEIGPTKKRLKSIISTLPATIDQAYEAILSKAKDQRRARKLLHIVVVAKRPLTLKEMNIALAIEVHHRSYEDLDLDVENEARFAKTIRNVCGLFVNIIDEKVYLIHQTAKEFLVATDQALVGRWKHSLDPVESELLMAKICITYLMFRTSKEDIFERYLIDDTALQHGYLGYAARFWCEHYKAAQSIECDLTLQSALTLCDTHSQRFQTWFKIYWNKPRRLVDPRGRSPDQSSITVASYFGHNKIVKLLLEAKGDVDPPNSCRTPLWWAASKGHEDTACRTPLWWAVSKGHEDTVEILLEAGANVNVKSPRSETPLWTAASNGHEGIVRLLLGAKAEIEVKGGYESQTPLSIAVANGHDGIVKLLLSAKAEIETKDRISRTPLWIAASEGHHGIAELLLKAGANVNRRNYGSTPLFMAASKGHEGIVKLLLKAGADINGKEFIDVPLVGAASYGHVGIVKLLLEANADVEQKDYNDGTALSVAVERGHDDIVELLLKAGATPI